MKFEKRLKKAQSTDFLRDAKRSHKAHINAGRRYEALVFPAYHGSPLRTNFFIVAWVYSFFRSLLYVEARIVDHKTGKHYVL